MCQYENFAETISIYFKSTLGLAPVDGLMEERRNFSALALELRLSCINPLTYTDTATLHENIFHLNLKFDTKLPNNEWNWS